MFCLLFDGLIMLKFLLFFGRFSRLWFQYWWMVLLLSRFMMVGMMLIWVLMVGRWVLNFFWMLGVISSSGMLKWCRFILVSCLGLLKLWLLIIMKRVFLQYGDFFVFLKNWFSVQLEQCMVVRCLLSELQLVMCFIGRFFGNVQGMWLERFCNSVQNGLLVFVSLFSFLLLWVNMFWLEMFQVGLENIGLIQLLWLMKVVMFWLLKKLDWLFQVKLLLQMQMFLYWWVLSNCGRLENLWLFFGVCIRYLKFGRLGKQVMVVNMFWWVWVLLEKNWVNSRFFFDSLLKYGVMLFGVFRVLIQWLVKFFSRIIIMLWIGRVFVVGGVNLWCIVVLLVFISLLLGVSNICWVVFRVILLFRVVFQMFVWFLEKCFLVVLIRVRVLFRFSWLVNMDLVVKVLFQCSGGFWCRVLWVVRMQISMQRNSIMLCMYQGVVVFGWVIMLFLCGLCWFGWVVRLMVLNIWYSIQVVKVQVSRQWIIGKLYQSMFMMVFGFFDMYWKIRLFRCWWNLWQKFSLSMLRNRVMLVNSVNYVWNRL